MEKTKHKKMNFGEFTQKQRANIFMAKHIDMMIDEISLNAERAKDRVFCDIEHRIYWEVILKLSACRECMRKIVQKIESDMNDSKQKHKNRLEKKG